MTPGPLTTEPSAWRSDGAAVWLLERLLDFLLALAEVLDEERSEEVDERDKGGSVLEWSSDDEVDRLPSLADAERGDEEATEEPECGEERCKRSGDSDGASLRVDLLDLFE